MYHKSWPSDVKMLEKRWASEQAKREVGEIGLLLGFGVDDEFANDDDQFAWRGFAIVWREHDKGKNQQLYDKVNY